MSNRKKGLRSLYHGIWLVDGVRTPFADYNTVLGLVSPIDLGIKVAREVFRRSGVSPDAVDSVVAGNMAQASFDAYMLPRHIGIIPASPLKYLHIWCSESAELELKPFCKLPIRSLWG